MATNCSKLMEFMMLIGRLKSTKRAGWLLRGVQNAESIADHMYRMGSLAFLAGPEANLNREKCIKISLVHDMAECIVGDITPSDNVSKTDKYKMEKDAMEHITGLVSSEVGSELFTLWEEYEHQTTPEARFVKDLDRFDMILQAYEYEKANNTPGHLEEFFDSTRGKFNHPMVKDWVNELNKVRAETLKKEGEDSGS